MSTFIILLGGDLTPTARFMAQAAGARVVAADAGIEHARTTGLTPELWVGDFDSATLELIDAYGTVPRQAWPADKDMTDGELAMAAALERGATRLILAGAFGGRRADHAFLHMTAAISVAETGVPAVLTSGLQEGHPLLHGENRFDFASGTLFSILPFSDLEGLSIQGAKWPLAETGVAFGSSLTISNAVTGPLAVTLASGRALLLAHPDAEF